MPDKRPILDPKTFLEAVGNGKEIVGVPGGETVFRQGDHSNLVYYLQTGRAKETVRSDQGKEAVVGTIEPGMFFGVSPIDGSPVRLSTVTTIKPCRVTSITRQAMKDAMTRPAFAAMFVAYLLHRNSKIEAEKIDLLFNGVEKRLMKMLLILAHFGEAGGSPRLIGPEITQTMLADMMGSTRPLVNKFLVKFRKVGFIKYSNDGISVQPALLRAVLQDSTSKETTNDQE